MIGLTSPGNVDFVEKTGVYSPVVTYEEVGSLPRSKAVYVDMSGNADVRRAVHERYGDDLAYSCAVGITHYEEMAGGSDLTGPKPAFFFAPVRIKKRGADWGAANLDHRVVEAWDPFVEWTSGWLEVIRQRTRGPPAGLPRGPRRQGGPRRRSRPLASLKMEPVGLEPTSSAPKHSASTGIAGALISPPTSAAGGRCRRAKSLECPRAVGTGRLGEPDSDAGAPPLGLGWADAHYLAA